MTRLAAVALLLLGAAPAALAQPTPTRTMVPPSPTLANSHAEPGTNGCAIGPPSAGAGWLGAGVLLLGGRVAARRRGRL
jgi:hypothetical protein